MIELKDYSLVELRKALKIPLRQWERHRDRLLEYFKEFFDYEYVSACGGRFDFVIFDEKGLNYLIEYDGEQHYGAVEYWGGEEEYAKRKERDGRKNQWAQDHNIPLIRIPYTLKDVHLRDLVPKTSKYIVKN